VRGLSEFPTISLQPLTSKSTKYHVLTRPPRTYKAIATSTASSGYRPDLRAPAVARASALRRAAQPKKETPASKPRGAKARKAAEVSEE
jgi:large subunit ribosomal protein L28e